MKVENGAAQQAYASAAYRNTVGPAGPGAADGAQAPSAAAPATPDSVVISDGGRTRALALEAVTSAPSSRAALVAGLRAQVSAGSYHVDDARLARSLAAYFVEP